MQKSNLTSFKNSQRQNLVLCSSKASPFLGHRVHYSEFITFFCKLSIGILGFITHHIFHIIISYNLPWWIDKNFKQYKHMKGFQKNKYLTKTNSEINLELSTLFSIIPSFSHYVQIILPTVNLSRGRTMRFNIKASMYYRAYHQYLI